MLVPSSLNLIMLQNILQTFIFFANKKLILVWVIPCLQVRFDIILSSRQIVAIVSVKIEVQYGEIEGLPFRAALFPNMQPKRNKVDRDNSWVDASDTPHSGMTPFRMGQRQKKAVVPWSSTPTRIHQKTIYQIF